MLRPYFRWRVQLKVQIEYHDNDSFTVEEVVKLAQNNYGKSVRVEITPDSPAPHDAIYFALQQIVTFRQLSLLYDNRDTYQKDIKMLRAEVLGKVAEILDSVIIDNEAKVS
jgi:hypothetical protein